MEEILPLKIIDKPFDQNIDSSAEPDETFKSEENDNVAHILNQVSQLSELDKYMLYLQLPTEETTEDGIEDTSKVHVTLMARRTDAAIKWIRQNYTETHDQSVFLPKEEVYEHYRELCELEGNKLLNSADFGKVMKLVFPKIAHRRLGQRGKSRYCYEGLKKKSGNTLSTCNACNRDLTEKPSPDVNLYALSCQIVCEWASQLLDRQLTDIKSLSEHLVSKGFSYGKAAAKFSLLSGSTGHHKQLEKDRKSPRFQDGQVLLQRKLLQKDIIRQHKKKLQEQQRFQRELAKTSPLILAHPGADGRRSRRVQPRPSSVQSYIPSWSSAQAAYSNGLLTPGQVSLNEVQNNVSQSNSRLMGILVSNNKDSLTPMKRCQSASVVEKYSDSLSSNVLDLFQERQDSVNRAKLLSTHNPAISSPSTTSDSTDTIMSSPTNTRGSSYLGSTKLESLLFQHYKRNGDNISPDGDSKRRCMTSLGVREQENFNTVHQSEASEFTRLRPYSCPVICSEQAQHRPVDLGGLSNSVKPNKNSKSETWPVKLKCDKKENKRDKSDTQDNKVHFVQKPTVINGRINNLHNVVSCPDFQQFTKNIDSISVQDVKPSRPSSNILNSLLSSDFDLSWRKSDALKPDSKSIISSPQSVTSSSSDLSSLTSHQLRMITDLGNNPESTVKLSNMSSRSAFVPVTSHKQLSNCILPEAKLPQLPPSFTVCKTPELSLNTSLPADLNCKSDSKLPTYTGPNFIPQTLSQSVSCLAPTPSVRFSEVMTKESEAFELGGGSLQTKQISHPVLLVPQAPSQSVAQKHQQAVSTPPLSSSPVTRVSASTPASHVISTSSPVSSTSTAFIITPPPSNTSTSMPTFISAMSSATTPLSSISVSIPSLTSPMVNTTANSVPTAPVNTSNSSTITPPRRASKNRFTPIRPKLGGSRSPQFTTTPSPPKKDSWPVSAILKEQRSINLAKGLLVNIGNNYQGEVKFQMPAELLCLAPGKSKTSDLLVTFSPSSNIPTTKGYTAVTNSSPLLWPLSSPTQQIKCSETLSSPVFTQSGASFALSGNSQLNETSSLQLITDNKSCVPSMSLTLCSPNILVNKSEPASTNSAVNKQLIILSPTKSFKQTELKQVKTKTAGSGQHAGDFDQSSIGQHTDQNIDLKTLLGLDKVSESKPTVKLDINSQNFLLLSDSSGLKSKENLTVNTSTPEFKGQNDSKPQVLLDADNLDKNLPNQKTMSLSSALLSELSQLVSSGHQPPMPIQQNSSSAFYKCTSQLSKLSENSVKKKYQEDMQTDSVKVAHPGFPLKSVENSNVHTCQTVRKRKVGTDEHGNSKKINRTVDRDLEDDVFIINIEDSLNIPGMKVNSPIGKPPEGCDKSVELSAEGGASNQLLTDTDKLLEMLPNTKYLTVKETVKALNDLRAKINFGSQGTGKNNCPLQGQADLDEGMPFSSSEMLMGKLAVLQSDASFLSLNKVNVTSESNKLPTRESRNVSLNVESLESDALLDLDQAWDLNLVGDGGKVREQKTSVGVAAKSVTSQHLHKHVQELLKKPAISTYPNVSNYPNVIAMNQTDKKQSSSALSASDNLKKTENYSSSSSKLKAPAQEKTSVHLDLMPKQVSKLDIEAGNSNNNLQQVYRRSSLTGNEIKQLDVQQPKFETGNGKASNHPTLAQFLSVPASDKVTPARSTSITSEIPSKEADSSQLDHELPGDILDFITESMCYRRQSSDISNSLTSSFYSEMLSQDRLEQSSTLLRSLSAPNTLALAHQANRLSKVNDIKVSLTEQDHVSFSLDCDTSGAFPSKNPDPFLQTHSNGIFLSPVGTAKMNRRWSVERSASNDPNTMKTPPEPKTNSERPPSRIKGSLEKCKTPVDRLISKLLTDKFTQPVWSRSSGGHVKEELNAEVKQEQMSVKLEGVKLPEKAVNKMLDQNSFCGITYNTISNVGKSDRSVTQTVLSNTTPASDIVIVRSSPSILSSANFFGDANRRDIISPATIFMPLRSDYSRNTNTTDSVHTITRTGNSTGISTEAHVSTKLVHFLDPIRLHEQVKLSSVSSSNKKLLEAELVSLSNNANRTVKIVNTSSSSQDLSTQLHCIPTPPSSPSNCHVGDSNHSSSHGNLDVKNVWNPDSYCSFRQDCHTSTASKDYQSANVESHHFKATASPKVPSPKVAPVTSPVPLGHSRTQPYNPHPSPPFTPSSQRCLASPRCPTPGAQTSGCTTPISDSNAAPNRFVPIQTSGILGSTAVGYIQPIRPVVTNVANVHSKSTLPSQVKSKQLELSNSIGQEAELNANAVQRRDQQSSERPVPPALVLSLTGGIGSVSGRGLKDGWAGHEMALVASGLPNQLDSKPESDSSVMMTTLHLTNDMLPTYEEAISLLVGSQNNYSAISETLKKTDRETVKELRGNDSLPRTGHSTNLTKPDINKPVSKVLSHLSQIGHIKSEAGDKTKPKKVDPLLHLPSKTNLGPFPQHPPPKPLSNNVSPEQKQTTDSSLRQLLCSKTSSLSTMLQAPAFTLVYPKPVSMESATKSLPVSDSKLKKESDWKSPSTVSEIWSEKWTSMETPESFHLSELPSACYSGTTPNKTIPVVSSFSSLPNFFDQQTNQQDLHHISMNFTSEMEHLRQDDLDVTLDVLKNLDSQYFPADEDEMV